MDSGLQKSKIFAGGRKRKNLNFSLGEKLLEMREDLLGKLEQGRVEARLFQFLFRYEFQEVIG